MASDGDLPRGIALAWGVAANPQRGPRRELSLEGIVDAAVQIADADGLGAVSMSSVASALGFTTMSLYRYVSAKDDLLVLMQEDGIGLPPLSITETSEWRAGLTQWYRSSLEAYAAHPWLLDIPIAGVPNTPNNLAWLDSGLQVLGDTPLDAPGRLAAVLLLSGQARWEAQIARIASDESDAPVAALASLITPEQFPHLFPVLTSGAFADESNPFEFGLSRILDGLEDYLKAGAPVAAPAPAPENPAIQKDERVKKANERVRDAENKLRDARQKQREARAKAMEKL